MIHAPRSAVRLRAEARPVVELLRAGAALLTATLWALLFALVGGCSQVTVDCEKGKVYVATDLGLTDAAKLMAEAHKALAACPERAK
jgi:hypothetical protein